MIAGTAQWLTEATDGAQIGVAAAAFLALLYARRQINVTRAGERRKRAYEYSDRFSREDTMLLMADYERYWEDHSYAEFKERRNAERARWKALTNWIEEVAALYNRGLIDRDVAAETMGVYVEYLWSVSGAYIDGVRREENDDWVYIEWEWMQADTRRRQAAARHKIERRLAWRKRLRAVVGR